MSLLEMMRSKAQAHQATVPLQNPAEKNMTNTKLAMPMKQEVREVAQPLVTCRPAAKPEIARAPAGSPETGRATGASASPESERAPAASASPEAGLGDQEDNARGDDAGLAYGVGREAGLFESKADRKRQWQRFMTTFEPTGPRGSKSTRAPADLDIPRGDLPSQKFWFPLWVQSKGDWASVAYEEILAKEDKDMAGTTDEWLTRDQVEDLYKSRLVADSICDMKLSNPKLTRRHPEIPHIEDARQFKVPRVFNPTEFDLVFQIM